MIHKFIVELTDDCKGYNEEVERLEREYGIEPVEEHDSKVRADAIQEVKEIIISWSNRVIGNDSVKYISRLIVDEIGEQCSNDRETKTCN